MKDTNNKDIKNQNDWSFTYINYLLFFSGVFTIIIGYIIMYLGETESMSGYLVTRTMTFMNIQMLVLCDFWLENATVGDLNQMIAAALASNHHRDIRLVVTMARLPNKKLGSTLWQSGLIRVPQRLLPQPVVVIGGQINGISEQPCLPEFSKWQTTPFDWDVF